MIYPINPCPKPRMLRSDKWKKRPAVLRYWTFCDEVRLRGVKIKESGSHVVFCIPMPKSWAKKKREKMNGKPHQQKPDVDNLIKSIFDALFTDDSHIYDIRATKVWAETGAIEILE